MYKVNTQRKSRTEEVTHTDKQDANWDTSARLLIEDDSAVHLPSDALISFLTVDFQPALKTPRPENSLHELKPRSFW